MVILVLGTFFLVSFADQKHQVLKYTSFEVEVLNPSEEALITGDEIRDLVTDRFGRIEGTLISLVDLAELEKMVRDNPYVSSCEVYQTISGELILKAVVRTPLVRIINDSGQQYFLDHSGFMIPVNQKHPAHVLVASGNISERLVTIDKTERSITSLPDTSSLRQIFPVATYIARDEFLASFIDQVYVNEKKEMELVPKIGNQEIIFGTAENSRQKLENLKAFYLKVMKRMDWNTYKVINLKYNNQVVCSK
jgi:cell division protein FtsQ